MKFRKAIGFAGSILFILGFIAMVIDIDLFDANYVGIYLGVVFLGVILTVVYILKDKEQVAQTVQ